MRIQHNIMAMGAYRNYTNNLSAMKKNLEKLSSGYKINRAGDDAAGLAISEKMRAQITGLETAQKNAKDGISLVQTAEGALTEVHDMLNRMVTLATQSANGTYDNDTDRLQLQKELDQLRSEIDRIADSSNFNGIKLLDGSLSKDGIASVSSKFDLPDVGLELGTDTVLHRDEDESTASTAFGMELHNVKFTGKAGDSFTIEIGGSKLTGTLATDMMGEDADHILTGEDMVAGLLGTDTSKVTFTDENGIAIDPDKVTIDGKEYSMVAGNDADKTHGTTAGEGTSVLFKLNTPENDVNVSMDVKVYANTAEGATNTAKMISGSASSKPVTPALGGISDRGTSTGKVNVKVITSSGAVNANKIGLVLKDTVTGTAATNPVVTTVTGKTSKFVKEATNGKYEITFDDDKIKEYLGTQTAATLNGKAGSLVFKQASAGSADFKLYYGDGTTAIASVTATDIAGAAGGTLEIKAGTTVLGQIKVTDLTDAATTFDAAAVKTDLASLSHEVGLDLATAKLSAADPLNEDKLTAAAVAAGAKDGKIELDFDSAANQVQLKIGAKVIGYADASKLNGSTLTFLDANGNNKIGSLELAGNTKLDSSKLAAFFKEKGPIETGLTYTDANVKSSVATAIDYEKLSAAAKKAYKAVGKEITGNEKLSLVYTGASAGHEFNLMLGDVKIGDGDIDTTAGKLVLNDLETTANALVTIDIPGVAAGGGNLAIDTSTVFDDLGPVIKPEEKTISTVKSTTFVASDVDAKNLAKTITEAAEKAGVEFTDKVDLTISYNDTDKKYELKAGDVVVGTADAAGTFNTTTKTLTLAFKDASNALISAAGNVTITELAADYAPEDLVGSFSTNITFDPNATPATNADFSGLNTDKLTEFAKDDKNSVTAGSKLQVVNDGNGTWTLQFNDGTNTVKVGEGDLSTDGMSIDFGDYGKVSLDAKYDESAITDAGAKELLDIAFDTGFAVKEKTLDVGISGDFLVTTSDQKNAAETAGDRLASTTFKLTSDMVKDGASIFVAGKNYTFSTGKDTVIRDGAIKVDISDLDANSSDYISAVAKRLTDTYAADNTGVYTLGWDGNRVSVTETKTHGNLKSDGSNDDTYPTGDEWDLRTMEGIAKSLGYSSAPTNGKELTLQIGDTAESFNQLKVNINDMHTAAMGKTDDDATSIADISIADQESAAKAVDVIKRAINYVSDVRGTLGATQNRLDHTINNLSVMTENIQDAESTIRDTDVAEEMMAYTKNNILIQSAQAMLAQANQVPQGVLQLLQ